MQFFHTKTKLTHLLICMAWVDERHVTLSIKMCYSRYVLHLPIVTVRLDRDVNESSLFFHSEWVQNGDSTDWGEGMNLPIKIHGQKTNLSEEHFHIELQMDQLLPFHHWPSERLSLKPVNIVDDLDTRRFSLPWPTVNKKKTEYVDMSDCLFIYTSLNYADAFVQWSHNSSICITYVNLETGNQKSCLYHWHTKYCHLPLLFEGVVQDQILWFLIRTREKVRHNLIPYIRSRNRKRPKPCKTSSTSFPCSSLLKKKSKKKKFNTRFLYMVTGLDFQMCRVKGEFNDIATYLFNNRLDELEVSFEMEIKESVTFETILDAVHNSLDNKELLFTLIRKFMKQISVEIDFDEYAELVKSPDIKIIQHRFLST